MKRVKSEMSRNFHARARHSSQWHCHMHRAAEAANSVFALDAHSARAATAIADRSHADFGFVVLQIRGNMHDCSAQNGKA